MPPFIKIFSTKCYHLHCWGNLKKSIRRMYKLSRDCLCILLRAFGGEGKIITIKKLSIYGKIRVSVEALALKRGGKMDLGISSDTVLRGDMTMLVLGEYKNIQKYFHI